MEKISFDRTVLRILDRLKSSLGCVNVFLLSNGVRTLVDGDPLIPNMMMVYGKQFVGRYNRDCPKQWIRDDLAYMAVQSVYKKANRRV